MAIWPYVAAVTCLVVLAPVAVVWTLRREGVIASGWIGAPLGAALSLLAALAAGAAWKRRSGAGDVPFGDLLLWGWLRRLRAERKVVDAAAVLSLDGDDSADRERILAQVAAALDAQDPYLDGHSRRVARYAAITARKMGLPAEVVARIRAAATIHDVGKLRVPYDVLRKPDALSEAEYEEIKRHAAHGADMAACLGDPELASIIRHHHERFDGAGYPDGLAGQWIPLGARIVAVADTFDALTSPRPYRPATSHKRALDVLVEEAGSQLDPAVVHAFLEYYRGARGAALWGLLAMPVGRPRELVPLLVAVPVIGALAAADVATVAHRDLVRAAGPVVPAATSSAARDPGRPAARERTAPRSAAHTVHPGSSTSSAPTKAPSTARRAAPTPDQAAGRTPAPTPARRHGAGRPRVSTPRGRTPRPVSTPPRRDRRPSAATPAPEPRPRPAPAPRPRPAPAPRPAAGPPAASEPAPPAEPPPVAPPPVVTPEPAPPPGAPTSKDDCKSGGYARHGFSNQGSCVAAVNQSQHGPG